MAPAPSRHGTAATAAGLGLAGIVGGAAFLSGTRQHSSHHQQQTSLRGLATGQSASRSAVSATASNSFATQAGIGAVAMTSVAAALLAQRGKVCLKPSITPLKAFESELGVQAPVGFWDPLGLARDGDVVAFQRRRSVELKHGRIAMLATMGYITPEVAGKFPGYLSPSAGLRFEDVPNGLAALSKVPGGGWTQILLYMGWCEVSRGAGSDIASGRPGDFGWYVLSSADPEEKTKKLNAEIANGRLAMMAIIGMFYQDGLTGSAWGDWANYTDSPLRAVDFSTELGVTPPLGFWDPLGLAAAGAGKTQDPEVIVAQFKRRRAVEIQHGRVAMFACIGYIVPEYFRWPGMLSKSEGLAFADIPNGLKAYSYIPLIGWAQILTFVGAIEVYNLAGVSDDSRTPGDSPLFGAFGVPGAGGISDPERRKKSLNAELNNGRLAMMAIIGMFFQDGLTGSAWGDWENYADSPLRAFENELGVQPPAGFWDPLGFTADGDAAAFRRRRYIELKHGRVSMFACLGYIVPEYYRWPGDLSPSSGLKFTDVPTGFAAFSKVPLSGWAQMIAFAGTVELFQYVDDPERAPGDFKNAGLLGVPNGFLRLSDEESRKKKLAAELANGRLAMMAIIGMFFQNGLTGSAWGDWAEYTASPLRAYENETGVQPPVGFWDPLGLAASGNNFDFKRRREVELKHGRVSMFATIGYIVPEYWRFPGSLCERYAAPIKFADMPNGLQAISKLPALGLFQIVLFAGLIETNVYNEQVNDEPGNYGAGFLGLRSVGIMNTGVQDPEVRKKKLNAELANGRLAMMAIIGMFFQDGLTGSAWGDWSNYTDSPLRAFEGELGVQAPVGFWDPVGYTRDGNVETFKRRRETEIKHGRVAMYATVGYIVPEYFKWPGYLSPSMGLSFEDVPNGLAAISKVPGQGWSQIVAFAGYYELFVYKYSGTPGDYGWKAITSSDPDTLNKKLSAELANGRLAMMAIIGMFFQDGLTGSAWGDWSNYTDSPLRAFENELGVQAPLGFWDPLGYTADGNIDDFTRRRVTEIKHGRVAMIACMGYITPEYVRWPALCSPSEKLSFDSIDNGLAALKTVPLAGWVQIVAFIGSVELFQFKYDPSRAPGDYEAAGVLGVPRTVQASASTLTDPETKKRKLNAEIANGRLAMMAIIGMFFQDGLTGSAWGNWELYTDSPMRAFEGELGVQAPFGYWDPAGLSADGDAEAFKRRRGIELKHGRVAMIACMGYMVPEYFRWPGFCSPTQGVAFEDVPNGLAALSKIPGAGWIQIVLFCGNLEIGFFKYDSARAPGDFANGGVLGVPNGTTLPAGELKNKKLNAELANGRLAMMAIIGMFFQDGLTGSAWGDWSNYADSPLRAFEGETGVQAPVGYWDPLGLSKDGDMATFKRRRSTELKHGRVAMFATLGYIVPESVKLPGYLSPTLKLSFSGIPNGLSALKEVPGAGWFQIVLFLGYCELAFLKEGDEPGNYGLGYLGALNGMGRGQSFIKAPEVRKQKLNAELANGRLAMMAIIGMFYQDGLTGSAWGDWSNYADSPLRAFENEPGCQLPLGETGKYIWDPAGLATDPETFRKYRSAEIKHGRVAMLATFALVFQHYYHFKALSFPDSYLDLSGAPNGVDAISTYPSNVGFACLVLSAGIAEMYFNDEEGAFPGDFGDPWGLKKTLDLDEVGLEKFRRYELEHGRLAMFGTIGTIAAEKVSGLDGVDQWNTDATRQAFSKFLTATTYGLANDGL